MSFGFGAAGDIIVEAIFILRAGKLFFLQNRSKLSFGNTMEFIRRNIEWNSSGWFTEREKYFNLAYKKSREEH